MIDREEYDIARTQAKLDGQDDFMAGVYSIDTDIANAAPDDVWETVKRLNERFFEVQRARDTSNPVQS